MDHPYPSWLGLSRIEPWLWMAAYGVIRLWFLWTHDGSFIDEYLHIFSGRELIANGHAARFYEGEAYTRGLGVSYAVGAAMRLLGPRLWAAKLVPIALGATSLLSLQRLGSLLWPQGAGPRRLSLLLFLLSPYTIFNHFYIRMYVLYEAALLASLWALAGLALALGARSPGQRLGAASLRCLLGWAVCQLVLLWAGREEGALPVCAGGALGLCYLYLAYRREPGRPAGSRALAVRSALLLGLVLSVVQLPQARAGIQFWLHGELHFTSAADHKYAQLFLWTLPVVTALFAVGVVQLLWGRAGPAPVEGVGRIQARRCVGLVALSLLLLHWVSSADLQITRGILYFMPLFGLVGAAAVSVAPRAVRVSGAVLALGNLALAAPDNFLREPGIPTEITYIDYARVYRDVRRRCGGLSVVDASPSPHIGLFYGVRPDWALFVPSRSKQDRMVEAYAGRYATVFGHIPSVRALPIRKAPACLIVRSPSAARLLSRPTRIALLQQRRLAAHLGITLYRLSPDFYLF